MYIVSYINTKIKLIHYLKLKKILKTADVRKTAFHSLHKLVEETLPRLHQHAVLGWNPNLRCWPCGTGAVANFFGYRAAIPTCRIFKGLKTNRRGKETKNK